MKICCQIICMFKLNYSIHNAVDIPRDKASLLCHENIKHAFSCNKFGLTV